MDTTVALFFSLGLVMSPADEAAKSVDTGTVNSVIVQQTSAPIQKAVKRHEIVKARIAVTNAWLASQRTERRNLAKKNKPI